MATTKRFAQLVERSGRLIDRMMRYGSVGLLVCFGAWLLPQVLKRTLFPMGDSIYLTAMLLVSVACGLVVWILTVGISYPQLRNLTVARLQSLSRWQIALLPLRLVGVCSLATALAVATGAVAFLVAGFGVGDSGFSQGDLGWAKRSLLVPPELIGPLLSLIVALSILFLLSRVVSMMVRPAT
jgi:hypothetical protein